MADKYSSGAAFTVLVPCHPHGTDPSQTSKLIGQPAPTRQTARIQWINRGNGSGLVGLMGGAIAAAASVITVTQANVTVGDHIIRVGPYVLRPAIDFIVGASDNALAINLAAAISNLQGFNCAVPGGAVVTINTTAGHGDLTRIEVVESGAASAFALTTPNKAGYMNQGAPVPGAPVLT